MGNIKVENRWITGVGLVMFGLVLACGCIMSGAGRGQDPIDIDEGKAEAEASPLPPTPTETVVYTASEDPCITFWGDKGGGGGQDILNITTGKAVLKRLPGGDYAAYSPDSQTIVTMDFPEVYLWRADSYDLMHTLTDVSYRLPSFSPDSKLLATIIDDQTIRLWDVESGNLVEDFEISVDPDINLYIFEDTIGAFQFSPNGDLIAVGVGRSIAIVDAASGEAIRLLTGKFLEFHEGTGHPVIENGPASLVSQLVFDNSGEILFIKEREGTIHLWEVDTGQYLRCIHSYQSDMMMTLSPDGRTIAVAGFNGILFYDATNGEPLSTWEMPARENYIQSFLAEGVGVVITSIDYSRDGRTIMVGLSDGTVRIYDVLTGELTGLLRHPGLVSSVAINGKSDRIITGIRGDEGLNEAWIWDAKHSDISLAVTVHNWLEEGVSMALGGDIEGAKGVFEQAQASNPFPEHDLVLEGLERVTLAFIDQATESAVAGDSQRALELIDLALEVNPHPELDLRTAAIRHLVREICDQAGRDLTQEEWDMYRPENPSTDTCP